MLEDAPPTDVLQKHATSQPSGESMLRVRDVINRCTFQQGVHILGSSD